VTPALIAMVLGTGLLALIPVTRLARRDVDRWVVAIYYVALWLLLLAAALVPGVRRLAIPALLVLAVVPWLSVPAAVARLLGRGGRRQPPRNVTPPEAGGPWRP
jgi:hypothetical protein